MDDNGNKFTDDVELGPVKTKTEETAEPGYMIYAMPDGNQAESLANYLTRHGTDAVAAGNEVTVPVLDADAAADVFQLRSYWRLFWRYSEAELYGLPVYSKPVCKDHQV